MPELLEQLDLLLSETRFRQMAARGSKRTGLALLRKLDRAFAGSR